VYDTKKAGTVQIAGSDNNYSGWHPHSHKFIIYKRCLFQQAMRFDECIDHSASCMGNRFLAGGSKAFG
jgi:hypothetical protein